MGAVKFTTIPPGAEIFLDGTDQGVKTDATVLEVPAGLHTYILKLGGFLDATGTVEATESQLIPVSISLTPVEGCIYLITTIPGAKIFVDEIDTGKVTPALICGLSLSTHTYRLTLSGYFETGGAVPMTPGQGAVITGAMNPIPRIEAKAGGNAGMVVLAVLGLTVLGAVVLSSRDDPGRHPPPARR